MLIGWRLIFGSGGSVGRDGRLLVSGLSPIRSDQTTGLPKVENW